MNESLNEDWKRHYSKHFCTKHVFCFIIMHYYVELGMCEIFLHERNKLHKLTSEIRFKPCAVKKASDYISESLGSISPHWIPGFLPLLLKAKLNYQDLFFFLIYTIDLEESNCHATYIFLIFLIIITITWSLKCKVLISLPATFQHLKFVLASQPP